MDPRKGMTLIEIVVSVALLAVLSTTYFIVANPAGQLASSRNSSRLLHLQTIMNGIRQNIADQSNEKFLCAAGAVPTTSTRMSVGVYNIAPCLVPVYLLVLPVDPSASGAHYTSNTDYDTAYSIAINSSTSQITVSAPFAELKKTISVTR